MAGHKSVKELRAVIEAEGLTILSAPSTSHVKFNVEYKGVQFVLVAGQNNSGALRRNILNFRGDVRRAKKAIDTGDEALMKKYLGANV